MHTTPEPKNKFQGNITIPIAIVGSVLIATITGAASYFGTVNAQNAKVADVKEELKEDISKDRQRITAVETDMQTIKSSQLRTEAYVLDILKQVK